MTARWSLSGSSTMRAAPSATAGRSPLSTWSICSRGAGDGNVGPVTQRAPAGQAAREAPGQVQVAEQHVRPGQLVERAPQPAQLHHVEPGHEREVRGRDGQSGGSSSTATRAARGSSLIHTTRGGGVGSMIG